jgi:hypothetical protein
MQAAAAAETSKGTKNDDDDDDDARGEKNSQGAIHKKTLKRTMID